MKKLEIPARNMVLMILIAAINLFRNFLWVLPAALMAQIMEELSLNYTQVGQLSLIVTVMMGMFLIIGSSVLGRIGPGKAMVVGLLCVTVDGICSFVGNSFVVVMIGKVFCGVGYGLTLCSATALIASCFPKKYKGLANGLNTCIGSLTIAMAYRFVVPLSETVGSWRVAAMLLGTGALLTTVLFILWYRKAEIISGIQSERKENNVLQALKYPIIRWFVLINSCVMLVYVSVNSYYPNYLHQVRGYTLADASSMVSILSVAGMIGSLFTGIVAARVKRPKWFLMSVFCILLASFVGMVLLKNNLLLLGVIFCFGFCYLSMSTFCVTKIMQLEGISPLTASAGASLMNACGSLLAIVVPSVQQMLTERIGLHGAMSAFALLLLPTFVGLLFLPASFEGRQRRS